MCLAFYLPQYHPIPETDRWWGSGFTEWRNVAKARPRFRGHYQPHLPLDLGFYDLRVPEVREQQAVLAREAGVDGFVYYHYWFNGTRLLERPFDDMLSSGRPNFPFCLAWANENWTRRWDGGDDEILIGQEYSTEDDLKHIRSLRPALIDDRYLTFEGKPVLLIYRSSRLPSSVATTDLWRSEVERWGLPGLYLLKVESFSSEKGDPGSQGYDAAVEFQPFWAHVPRSRMNRHLRYRLGRLSPRFLHNVHHYDDLVSNATRAALPDYARWPGVTPGFDNSARRQREATILLSSTPESYRRWLVQALRRSDELATRTGDNRGLVFINAWNEWAEGNHLEPDLRDGRAFLDATRAAVNHHRALQRRSA
jgi:lipopolysaccharide biosynthesis protein